MHTLEDFTAHSNFCELVLVAMGYHNVFLHVGDSVRIQARNGRMVAPLVTGTAALRHDFEVFSHHLVSQELLVPATSSTVCLEKRQITSYDPFLTLGCTTSNAAKPCRVKLPSLTSTKSSTRLLQNLGRRVAQAVRTTTPFPSSATSWGQSRSATVATQECPSQR